MSSSRSVTGERLHEEEVEDVIPGATPFFQVELDDNYTPPEGLPSNPQDYLKSVVHEARNIPDVVVAKISPGKMKPKAKPAKYIQSKYIMEKISDHHSLAPPREWQKQRLADFAITREEYVRHLAKLKSISRQTKKRPKLPIYPLPPWDDEMSWKYLCFGQSLERNKIEENRDNKDEINGSSRESDDEASDVDEKVQNALAAGGRTTADISADQLDADDRIVDLSTLEEGFPPMMRILLRMDSNQVEANLEYHTRWMEEHGFSHEQGRWIYALLSCLEKPLFPTVISVLRDLSRKCIEMRSRLESCDDQVLSGLNLIVCIVGRYFEQTDLADPW